MRVVTVMQLLGRTASLHLGSQGIIAQSTKNIEVFTLTRARRLSEKQQVCIYTILCTELKVLFSSTMARCSGARLGVCRRVKLLIMGAGSRSCAQQLPGSGQ